MNTSMAMNFVIPAQAGIQCFYSTCLWVLSRLAGFLIYWIPAFAGMTDLCYSPT